MSFITMNNVPVHSSTCAPHRRLPKLCQDILYRTLLGLFHQARSQHFLAIANMAASKTPIDCNLTRSLIFPFSSFFGSLLAAFRRSRVTQLSLVIYSPHLLRYFIHSSKEW